MNFVATQYIAARFHYQAALGAPILRSKSVGIYQPFSWIAWGWRYCTSQDERIRRPFFEGEMIAFAGSFLCIGIFFVLANRRTRKLTENAEDLHGSKVMGRQHAALVVSKPGVAHTLVGRRAGAADVLGIEFARPGGSRGRRKQPIL